MNKITPGSKWGLVVRTSSRSRIPREEYSESINNGFQGTNLRIIAPVISSARAVHEFDVPEDGFISYLPEKDFLMYKSLGSSNLGTRHNTELKRLVSENGLTV